MLSLALLFVLKTRQFERGIAFAKFTYVLIQIVILVEVDDCGREKQLNKCTIQRFNPLEPEFTIVIFIHYKPRIAVAILYL